MRIGIEHCLRDVESLQHQLLVLEALAEERSTTLLNTFVSQQTRKFFCNSKLVQMKFNVDDLVFPYESRFFKFPSKLQSHWLGPYEVGDVNSNGLAQL